MLSTVTFLYPQAAWLLLLLPLLWWIAPSRRWSHVAIRAAAMAGLVLALMQPSVIHRSGAAPRVFLVDQRDDLSPAARGTIRTALARRLAATPPGPRVVLQLGGTPILTVADADTRRETLPGGSLSVGLTRAVQGLPPGVGSVTLISDGRSTDTHWERAIQAIVARGIPVDTIAVADPVARAFIAGIDAASVRVGERAVVTVDVEGDGHPHRLTLTGGGGTLGSAEVTATGVQTLRFAVPALRAGFLPVRATLSDAGAGATMDAVIAVQDPLALLYLGERQQGAAPRLQRLLGEGFAVTRGDPRTIPAPGDLARFPLVMLDDVTAAGLPIGGQRALTEAIAQKDVGLLATGGEAAFGPGGYATAPIGRVLPVLPRPVERVEEPSVALAIVVDTSGSMDGVLIDLAKQIARRTAAKLKSTDQLGVVEFYGAQQWVLPMQPVTDPAAVDRAISRLQAQGSTVLYPAIQEAYYGLKDVTARYRHILVISDGGVEENRYQQLLTQIAQDRINVSTVQVGTDSSGTESMANWARIGRGRFYSVPDENALVEIDFRQPQVKPDPGYRSGPMALRDTAGQQWWRSAGISTVPPLDGYARVTARPQAETLLATTSGDPVLATWQYGGGRVTALATEPLGAGSAVWARWSDYGRWLARIAGMTARQRPEMAITLDRRFDRVTVSVQRLDGAAGPQPAIRFVAPSGAPVAAAATFEQRAPGLFVADVAWPSDRAMLVEARDGAGATVRAADRARSDVSTPGAVPPERALPLDRLAALTGGRFADGIAGAGTPPPARPGGLAAADLWPWFALLGLILYFADLYIRRTPRRARSGPSVPA